MAPHYCEIAPSSTRVDLCAAKICLEITRDTTKLQRYYTKAHIDIRNQSQAKKHESFLAHVGGMIGSWLTLRALLLRFDWNMAGEVCPVYYWTTYYYDRILFISRNYGSHNSNPPQNCFDNPSFLTSTTSFTCALSHASTCITSIFI